MATRQALSRRSFLQSSVAGVGLASTLDRLEVQGAGPNPYGGFKMGIQSYSLREYDTEQALAWTQRLGLEFWESYRKHFPIADSPATIREYKKKLSDHGVTLMAYGVQPFTKDTDANRKQFEFAKAMGIATLSADPTPDSLDNLDKLVEEYQVNIAIHNHGPRERYDKIEDTLRAMRNHHERIGACVDTGHYLRSDEDPVKAIIAFGPRTYGAHLKDVKKLPDGKKHFTILGQGDLDVVECLRALKKLKFQHCLALEYEENPSNPIPDIRQCLAVVRDAVRKL